MESGGNNKCHHQRWWRVAKRAYNHQWCRCWWGEGLTANIVISGGGGGTYHCHHCDVIVVVVVVVSGLGSGGETYWVTDECGRHVLVVVDMVVEVAGGAVAFVIIVGTIVSLAAQVVVVVIAIHHKIPCKN